MDVLYGNKQVRKLLWGIWKRSYNKTSKNDRGIVYVETVALDQNSIKVLRFRRKVLVRKSSK